MSPNRASPARREAETEGHCDSAAEFDHATEDGEQPARMEVGGLREVQSGPMDARTVERAEELPGPVVDEDPGRARCGRRAGPSRGQERAVRVLTTVAEQRTDTSGGASRPSPSPCRPLLRRRIWVALEEARRSADNDLPSVRSAADLSEWTGALPESSSGGTAPPAGRRRPTRCRGRGPCLFDDQRSTRQSGVDPDGRLRLGNTARWKI